MRILLFCFISAFLFGCSTPGLSQRDSDVYKVPFPENAGHLEMELPKKQFPYALNKPVQLWRRKGSAKRIYNETDKYYKPIMIVPYKGNYLFLLKDGVTVMSLEFEKGMAELTLLGSASDESRFNLDQWHGRGLKRQLSPEIINALSFQFESFLSSLGLSPDASGSEDI